MAIFNCYFDITRGYPLANPCLISELRSRSAGSPPWLSAIFAPIYKRGSPRGVPQWRDTQTNIICVSQNKWSIMSLMIHQAPERTGMNWLRPNFDIWQINTNHRNIARQSAASRIPNPLTVSSFGDCSPHQWCSLLLRRWAQLHGSNMNIVKQFVKLHDLSARFIQVLWLFYHWRNWEYVSSLVEPLEKNMHVYSHDISRRT